MEPLGHARFEDLSDLGDHLSLSVSVLWDSAILSWTVARQAPLSMEFFRQEYWNCLSFPTSGDLPSQTRVGTGVSCIGKWIICPETTFSSQTTSGISEEVLAACTYVILSFVIWLKEALTVKENTTVWRLLRNETGSSTNSG